MIRHVASIGEIVEDIDAAVHFYRDVLGLRVEHTEGSGYGQVEVAGTLHFGLWARKAAAEATFGSSGAADRVPLGFTVEFEVDDVEAASKSIASEGWKLSQPPKKEDWGQVTSRFISPGGSLCGISETPWAREIQQKESDSSSA